MNQIDYTLEIQQLKKEFEEVKSKQNKGCEFCRGWDKRCGANYCPMCGKELVEWPKEEV